MWHCYEACFIKTQNTCCPPFKVRSQTFPGRMHLNIRVVQWLFGKNPPKIRDTHKNLMLVWVVAFLMQELTSCQEFLDILVTLEATVCATLDFKFMCVDIYHTCVWLNSGPCHLDCIVNTINTLKLMPVTWCWITGWKSHLKGFFSPTGNSENV